MELVLDPTQKMLRDEEAIIRAGVYSAATWREDSFYLSSVVVVLVEDEDVGAEAGAP